MRSRARAARISLATGLAIMLVGAIDPLEGSLVILLGALLASLGATLGESRERRRLRWAFVLVAAGTAAVWGLSAAGGVGGNSGRSMAWLLLALPYPAGWALGVVSAVRALWAFFRARAGTSAG